MQLLGIMVHGTDARARRKLVHLCLGMLTLLPVAKAGLSETNCNDTIFSSSCGLMARMQTKDCCLLVFGTVYHEYTGCKVDVYTNSNPGSYFRLTQTGTDDGNVCTADAAATC